MFVTPPPRSLTRFLISLAFVWSWLSASGARAQSQNNPDEGEIGRLRKEAEEAMLSFRIADAFSTLEKVFAATRNVWDACNLGRTAYRLGKMREACEYLNECDILARLLDAQKMSADDKHFLSRARADLALARQNVARLWIFVNRSGADILIDGKRAGKSPVARELALDPGIHQVKATLGRETAEARVDIAAGEVESVHLVLEAVGGAASASAAPDSPKPSLSDLRDATSIPTPKAAHNAPRLTHPKRTWPMVLIWTGAGVAVIGTGIAAGAFVAMRNAAEDARQHYHTANAWGCYGAEAECIAYDDARASFDTANIVFDASLGVSGVLAGTLLSAGLIGEITTPVRIHAAPTVGGITLRGTF